VGTAHSARRERGARVTFTSLETSGFFCCTIRRRGRSLETGLLCGQPPRHLHGTADELISHHMSLQYFTRQEVKFGPALSQSMRFYLVPGLGHGTGAFAARFAGPPALENWVKKGIAPSGLVATAGNRSRLLCEYHTVPRYVSGDINQASSFTCAPAGEAAAGLHGSAHDCARWQLLDDVLGRRDHAQPSRIWWQKRALGNSDWTVVPGSSPRPSFTYAYTAADNATKFRAIASNDAGVTPSQEVTLSF
jgi:hypothetical protein